MALGRFQRDGDRALRFAEIEGGLAGLLRDFGPPRETSPGYPFHHLVTDGLWVVTGRDGGGSPGAGLGALRAADASGRLAPEFAAALRDDPLLLPRVVRVLLDANFPPSLHGEICAAVGLDLEAAELAGAGASGLARADTAYPADPADPATAARRVRSTEFRSEVLLAYEYRCAFCGYDGLIRRTAVGLDAAHVRWWAFGGPDAVANGLALCSLHHKLFDQGVLGLDGERRVAVSAHFIGRSEAARGLVLDLVGRPVLGPQAVFEGPGAEFVDWHRRQVFQSPGRQRVDA